MTSNGRYSDVYEDLVAYLRTIDTPLVILDEPGTCSMKPSWS